MSEFDNFAENYNESLRKSLALTRTSDKYQAEYKVRLLKNQLLRGTTQLRILDFGCGVGLSLPYLLEQFSDSKIFATDVSEVSLNIVRAEMPQVTIVDSPLNAVEKFDIIFVSTVLHHITSSIRVEILKNLRASLKSDGCLVVIEHNTYISQPVERSSVTTYSSRTSGTSLLRDLQGRCFERVIDRNGNEIRTEIDASECDF